MDFSLTEEQQLLKDSVDRFVRENYEFEDRRKLAGSGDGYSVDNWMQMVTRSGQGPDPGMVRSR